jgi:PHD/YefM family antitoxin component YafN of YafNO toxin-antitoxin module
VTRKINQGGELDPLVIWQRNYYEHVILSDKEYERIEAYILENPLCWLEDEENF